MRFLIIQKIISSLLLLGHLSKLQVLWSVRPCLNAEKNIKFINVFMVLRCALLLCILLSCATEEVNRVEKIADSEIATEAQPSNIVEPSVPLSTSTKIEDEENNTDTFIASEELYVETFLKVDDIIVELNDLISNGNFEEWLEYLSMEFREFYNNPEELAEISKSKRMQTVGITLESIYDYFNYVVVPSRINIRLDELNFQSPTIVEAIMIIDGERFLVYKLEFFNGNWKIIR